MPLRGAETLTTDAHTQTGYRCVIHISAIVYTITYSCIGIPPSASCIVIPLSASCIVTPPSASCIVTHPLRQASAQKQMGASSWAPATIYVPKVRALRWLLQKFLMLLIVLGLLVFGLWYHRVTPICVLTISNAVVFVPACLLTRTLLPPPPRHHACSNKLTNNSVCKIRRW